VRHERQPGQLLLFIQQLPGQFPTAIDAVQLGQALLNELTEPVQDSLFAGQIGSRLFQLRLPLFPQVANFSVDGGEDESQLDQRVPHLVSEHVAALQALAGQGILSFREGFADVEGKEFGAQGTGELLDDLGTAISPFDRSRFEVDFDDGYYNILGVSPDSPVFIVHRILGLIVLIPV